MQTGYLDAIRKFEGFTPKAEWDYAQFTNGYGTRAKFAGEVIDKSEADKRFASEISKARAFVDAQVPNADEGTKAALTSLTFNAGESWSRSGLGDAVRRGDLEAARSLFLQYDKAGGQVLPGLVSRRTQEAMWIGAPQGALGASDVASAERGVSVGASSSRVDVGAMDRLHAMVAAPSGSVAGSSSVPAGQSVSSASDGVDSLLDDDGDRTYQAGFSVMRRGGRPELTAAAMLLMHGTLAKLGPRTQDKG